MNCASRNKFFGLHVGVLYGVYVWDGNYYALSVTERLGVEESGGMVRVGAAHYNTLDEVARLGDVLKK